LIANPIRLLEILDENPDITNLNGVTFLIIDEYIMFRKVQHMDYVKRVVEKLQVRSLYLITVVFKLATGLMKTRLTISTQSDSGKSNRSIRLMQANVRFFFD
jgi:hypothetical protein